MPILGILASSYAVRGSYESIATVAVGSGGAGTVSFTSIPQSYRHLQLRMICRATTSNDNVYISSISGDTGNNYVGHFLFGNGSTAAAAVSSATSFVQIGKSFTSSTPGWAATIVDFVDYSNTNKNKTLRCLTGVDDNAQAAGPFIQMSSALWMNTSAITSFNLTTNGNFPQYSHFALYGIKAA